MKGEYNPHKVENGKEIEISRRSDGRVYSGNWCLEKMDKEDSMITFGSFGDKIRGPRQIAQLTLDTTYETTLVTGRPDCGKNELIRNIKMQLISNGNGFVNVLRNKESAQELLDRIPDYKLDDVIYIEYPAGQESVGFNMLQPPVDDGHEMYEKTISEISEDLTRVLKNKSSEWDPKISNVLQTILEIMINSDDPFNLIDLVNIVIDEDEREAFVENYSDDVKDVFIERIENLEISLFEPVLRLLRSWIESRPIRNLVANSESDLDLYEAMLQDKTVIFDLSDLESESTTELAVELINLRLKTVISCLTEKKSHVVLENKRHFGSNFSSLVNATKDTDTGILVSIDRMNKFEDELKQTFRSFNNKISFSTRQDGSEASVVAQMYNIASKDLINLNEYMCFSYVMTEDGYKSEVPVKVSVFRDRPPVSKREIDDISQRSIGRLGGETISELQNSGCLRYLS